MFFSVYNVSKVCVSKNIPEYSIYICTECDYKSPLWMTCKISSIISYWRKTVLLYQHAFLNVVSFSVYNLSKVCVLKNTPVYSIYICTERDYKSSLWKICKISIISFWRISLAFIFLFLYTMVPSMNVTMLSYYHYTTLTIVPFYIAKVLVSCDIILQYYRIRKPFSCTKCYSANMCHWCVLWNMILWIMYILNLLYPNFLYYWYLNACSNVFSFSTANLNTFLWWGRMDEFILILLNLSLISYTIISHLHLLS